MRDWRGGDVRTVVLRRPWAVIVVWGIIALKLAQPIVLLQVSANVAGVVFVVASLHLLHINTRLLQPALRPPMGGVGSHWCVRRCSMAFVGAVSAQFCVNGGNASACNPAMSRSKSAALTGLVKCRSNPASVALRLGPLPGPSR